MKQFKIGKDTVNDHVIENDPTVSRVHLAVFIDDEKNIFVTDLGSTNGTYVNGVRIVESVKLKTYDILRIGNTLVNWKRFLDDDDNPEEVYETLNDGALSRIDENLSDAYPSIKEKYNFENKLFDTVIEFKLPFTVCLSLFCISFFLPVLKEFDVLGYEVAFTIDSIRGAFNTLANVLVLITFFLKKSIHYKIKIIFLVIFFILTSRFLLSIHLSEFSFGYFFWYVFGNLSMLFLVFINNDNNGLIKKVNNKKETRYLIPIWPIITVGFVILISFFINLFMMNKSNHSDKNINNGNINEKSLKNEILNNYQPRKQQTNVTYDFSCLNSYGDAGTNNAIYNFGEITRDIQSSFFDDIDISVDDEQKQGRKLLKAYKQKYRFIESGAKYQNLNNILKNLVSRLAKPRGFTYKIHLLNDPTLNAVTLGGHIFFYKGMYDFCKTSSEISAIISHEIAHNELGHLTLAIKKQKAADDWGIIGNIFLEIESETTKSFNQKQESEADLFGMDLVYPTNFKNCDAIALWNRMSQNENRFDVIDNFFRSHPYSKNRSKCIKNHLKSNYNKNCY